MNQHEMMMQRALQLARLGEGNVAPNPLVGCVIVHPEKGIIGEGYHQKYGGPHAEVNAIASVSDSNLLKQSIIYVTLEPCSHFGKTPPCADLIIEKGFQQVVVCNADPNPLVSGQGFKKLRAAGIKVQTGLLEAEGLALNRKFFTAQIQKRPFVTLKWAQTADGFIARKDGSSKWISSSGSRQLVHKWRAEHQAILVGRNTLKIDNPTLTVRDWTGPNPIRIVVDPNLSLPQDLLVFTDSSAQTWVFNSVRSDALGHIRNVRVADGNFAIQNLLHLLWNEGIHALFVEGGSSVLNQFIESDLWDEAFVFESHHTFESGIPCPDLTNHVLVSSSSLGPDLISKFRHRNAN